MQETGKTMAQKERILSYIVENILSRRFDVGEKFFSEHFIAKKLDVNRSAVHQVYYALELIGIVKSIHGEGTYLRKAAPPEANSPLGLLLFLQDTDYDQILDFRRMIEVAVVPDAIQNLRPKQLQELKDALEIMRTTQDPLEASSCDIRIHTIIANAAGNALVSFVYNMAVTYITALSNDNWEEVVASGNEEQREELCRQHAAVIHAVEAKNEEACKKAVIEHIVYIKKRWGK